MLIRYFVENFSSFGTRAEFSMVSGRQRIHPEHLFQAPCNDLRLLRAGVVYGANASGKSNLVKSIAFAQALIKNGTQPAARIAVRPFLLDAALKTAPSVFQFTFCTGGNCYTYGFKLTAEKIVEEWLFEVVREKENRLFERTTDGEGNAVVEFAPSLIKAADDRSFLSLIARGTRPNQLFLTESILRNVKQFQPAWDWFANRLVVIFPESRAMGVEFAFKDKSRVAPVFMDLLRTFDTGIADIDAHEMPLDDSGSIVPPEMRAGIDSLLLNENANALIEGPGNVRYSVRRNEKGELVALKLRARHSVRGSTEPVSFDFSEESDGTRRMVDLMPAMMGLLNSDRVVVIDEIDRSLHPLATYAFFDLFLREGAQRTSQLIATTHAENLLTFKLLRKDEIWFVDKNKDGESRLFSLEEFNPRYDKDILTGYMNGRFGAVPSIVRVANPMKVQE